MIDYNDKPVFPNVHLGYLTPGLTLQEYIIIKLAAAMASTPHWPVDSDWEEITRRAVLGASTLLITMDKIK